MENLSILKTYSALEQTAIAAARERANDGGVFAHSSGRAYAIFCTPDPRSFLRWALANDLGFKPLRGCYKGQIESSFIVNTKDLDKIMPFINGEETVLHLHDYNARDVPKATLITVATGEREELGLFVQASEKQALALPSWTFDPMQGLYFVCWTP